MKQTFAHRLDEIGLPVESVRRFENRRQQSKLRLAELARRLRKSPQISAYSGLAIYAAGSYARGEASEHSDIDLFFIHDDIADNQIEEPKLQSIRVMSAVIQEMEEGMEFPAPSNDGQFFNILPLSKIFVHLGGPEDDHKNYFTARMLLLLESAAVYGVPTYKHAIASTIEAYLRDYEDHADDFRPTFLVNDIIRFWKTLCLNYEHRRNQANEARKIKQKIRNFKLQYSRMATCFSTVALLSSYNHISREELIPICSLTPVERLLTLGDRVPIIKTKLEGALTSYHWFLEKTELSVHDLESYFSNRDNRVIAFRNAREFGDVMYDILKTTAEHANTLRYLLV